MQLRCHNSCSTQRCKSLNFSTHAGFMHGRARLCKGKLSRQRRRGQQPQRRSCMPVFALDAAMPFDFEHKAVQSLKKQRALNVAIVGFGNFGQFLARRLIVAGHNVSCTSRGDYGAAARTMGATFYPDVHDLCEAHPDVVILASSILSTKAVLRSLPVQRLRRSTLFVDVLSVKVFPKQLMLAELPKEMDVVCTHPMFGPDSGKGSWKDLNLMYERVRVGPSAVRQQRVATFLKFFEDEGCKMVEMSCEEHDRHAASTQFITHTVGRVLGQMAPQSTPIDTKGYQSLLNLVDNTNNDSFELYYGLFMYNPNATEELKRLESAFNAVRQNIFTRLHDVVRDQIFLPQPGAQVPESSSHLPEAATLAESEPEMESPQAGIGSGNGARTSHATSDVKR